MWRAGRGPFVEILLIHRPGHDDWSLPKGKLHRGETALKCARREVHEETGLWCNVGAELPDARYHDRKGRLKHVRYWAMQRRSGSFRSNPEVDEVQWVDLDRVADVLTAPYDRVVVAGFQVVRAAVA